MTSNAPVSENSLAISQDGADYSYISQVQIGSSEKEMWMLVDSGSANTWVMGSNCTTSACANHNVFGAADSTSLQPTNNPWAVSYGTGTVSGIVATDTVRFANFTLNMGFGMATNASVEFNNYPMDGILGLGRATSNELGVPTVMDNLKSQGKLAQNVLGIHLNRASDNTKDGEIVFGGVDTGRYTGNITYTTTASASAWEIPVDDIFVNNSGCGFNGKTAIIDTGTSYILMPPTDAKRFLALIPGSVNTGETFTVPCDSKVNVQVSFSGVRYSISAKDYIGRTMAGNTCSCNIIGHQAFGANQWIFGDVFMKNVYTVFDFDQARVGFAVPGVGGTANGVVAAIRELTNVIWL
ncbi:hypothetical protein R6Q59_010058 [Mikania micrantha]